MHSDSQCLSPPRPSAQTVRVYYEIVPLIVKCKAFFFVLCFFFFFVCFCFCFCFCFLLLFFFVFVFQIFVIIVKNGQTFLNM